MLETIRIAPSDTDAFILENGVNLSEDGPFAGVGTPGSPHQRLDGNWPRLLNKRAFLLAIPHTGFEGLHTKELKGNLI